MELFLFFAQNKIQVVHVPRDIIYPGPDQDQKIKFFHVTHHASSTGSWYLGQRTTAFVGVIVRNLRIRVPVPVTGLPEILRDWVSRVEK